MRILVTGDRNWHSNRHYDIIASALVDCGLGTTIIHGDARGVDRMAGELARMMSIPVIEFPADWNQYGRKAGAIRNRQMYREGKPDIVLAFHSDLANSKGTKDMVMVARRGGTPVRIYDDCGLVEETVEVPTLHFEA